MIAQHEFGILHGCLATNQIKGHFFGDIDLLLCSLFVSQHSVVVDLRLVQNLLDHMTLFTDHLPCEEGRGGGREGEGEWEGEREGEGERGRERVGGREWEGERGRERVGGREGEGERGRERGGGRVGGRGKTKTRQWITSCLGGVYLHYLVSFQFVDPVDVAAVTSLPLEARG